MPLPLLAAGIGAAGSIAGALIGSSSAKDAAKQQAKAQAAALDVQQRQFNDSLDFQRSNQNEAIGYLKPFQQSGLEAQQTLAAALGLLGPAQQRAYFQRFQNDPGFWASQQAGLDAIGQSGVGIGNYRSGNMLKSLFAHGQQGMFGQFQDRLNRLQNASSLGANVAGNMGSTLAGTGSSIGNTMMNSGIPGMMGQIGATNAAGTLAQGNAWAQGLSGAGQSLAYGLANAPNDLFGK